MGENLIYVRFNQNRSKYLSKSIKLAEKADRFLLSEDEVSTAFQRNKESLRNLYYLFTALQQSHQFKIDVGIEGHVLTKEEIYRFWDILSCHAQSYRVKHQANYCHLKEKQDRWKEPVGFVLNLNELLTPEAAGYYRVPCKQLRGLQYETPDSALGLFLDTASSKFCNVCPQFNPENFKYESPRSVERDAAEPKMPAIALTKKLTSGT